MAKGLASGGELPESNLPPDPPPAASEFLKGEEQSTTVQVLVKTKALIQCLPQTG